MTIQQKNKALVIGFLGILILGYFLAISETLQLKNNYESMQQQELLNTNIPQRLATLEQKERYYDSLLEHYQITETSLQNNLLQTIDRYAANHMIKVVSFSEPHSFVEKDKKTNSYAFSVSGDFKGILGLAYELEQRSKFGMIASLDFEKKTNYRNGTKSLEGHFILQLVQ